MSQVGTGSPWHLVALGLEALELLPCDLAGALGPKAQSASGGRYHWLVYEIEKSPDRIEGCLTAARGLAHRVTRCLGIPFAGAFYPQMRSALWGAAHWVGTKFRMGDLCYPWMSPER